DGAGRPLPGAVNRAIWRKERQTMKLRRRWESGRIGCLDSGSRGHAIRAALVALLLVAGALWAVAFAAPGDLDSTFGTAGKALVAHVSPKFAWGANDLALQPDGRILLALHFQSLTTGQSIFGVARVTPQGNLDP